MNNFLTIREAAEVLGVSTSTLRRWEREGKLTPDERTAGNQRRYKLHSLRPMARKFDTCKSEELKTIAYARVSSNDQKTDLARQEEMLSLYCSKNGWTFEVIKDLGSGMNYNKKGLKDLVSRILNDDVGRLVLTHKDRLLRFGAELIFSICEMKNIEVVIINQGEDTSFEEDLAKDVLEIITVFSARLYGSRSHKNKKMIEKMQEAVTDE